jgi:hypothetical protein
MPSAIKRHAQRFASQIKFALLFLSCDWINRKRRAESNRMLASA